MGLTQHSVGEFTTVSNGTPDALLLLGPAQEIAWMNPAAARLLGIHPEDQGKLWTEVLPTEAQASMRWGLSVVLQGQPHRFQALLPGAIMATVHHCDVLMTPLRGQEGALSSVLVILREREPALPLTGGIGMNSIEAAEVLENMHDAFFILDAEWRLTYLNPQAERLVGLRATDLLGRDLWEAFPDLRGSSWESRYREAMREQKHVCHEDYYTGLNTWFTLDMHPHRGGLAVYFQDISERKREERTQEDRNTILEMVVRGQPLSEVLNQVALMVERQLPGYACSLTLKEGDALFVAAAPSLPVALRDALDGLPVDEEPLASMIRGTVIVKDLEELTPPNDLRTLLLAGDFRSCTAVPISNGHAAPLGSLAVFGKRPLEKADGTIMHLDRASQLSGVAIEHHHLTAQLLHHAKHDPLTGLMNREAFNQCLEETLQAVRGDQEPLAFLLSILTISRASTIPLDITWATRCSRRWRADSRPRSEKERPWRASVATSSRPCCLLRKRTAQNWWRAESWKRWEGPLCFQKGNST